MEGTHNNPLGLASDDVLRGPLADAVPSSAHRSEYSLLHDRDQLQSASMCGSCHDIQNDHGTHIERSFAEWQGSVFAEPVIGTTCGQCHMDQSVNLEPVAPGGPARRLHSHRFPAVDLPIDREPDEVTRQAVQSFLDTSLQSALCVRGLGGQDAQIQLVLDNVAAGHAWPSGSAQDRRAWVELVAYAQGAPFYQSGVVPVGSSVSGLEDPDLWLIRDCMFDATGNETHDFGQRRTTNRTCCPDSSPLTEAIPVTTRATCCSVIRAISGRSRCIRSGSPRRSGCSRSGWMCSTSSWQVAICRY